MSTKANPTIIGLFVVLSLLLGVAATVTFSKAKFFSKSERYILYFDASVEGLNVGAPVKFRGVNVGSVSEIMIRHNQGADDLFIPVIIEISEDVLQAKSDREFGFFDEVRFEEMVDNGLRGRLEAQSLVTGLLFVQLEIVPMAPPPSYHQVKPIYKEIPTMPTEIQELLSNLASLDVKGITDRLNSVLDRLDTSLGELQVREINRGITNVLGSFNRLAQSSQLTNSLRQLELTLAEYQALAQRIDSKVEPLAQGANAAMTKAGESLVEIRRGVQDLRDMFAPQAPLRMDLLQAVHQLGEAAESIARLADFLGRHPNSILSGRQPNNVPAP